MAEPSIARVAPRKSPACANCGAPKELHIGSFVWPRQLAEDVHDGAIDATINKLGAVLVGGQPIQRLPACKYRKGRSPLRGTKVRVLRRSKDWEREIAAATEGVRLGNTGRKNLPDVVVLGADGAEIVAIEGKEYQRITLALLESALQQAQSAARGRRGSPVSAAAAKEKRGMGVKAQRRVLMDFSDFASLVRLARQA